MDQTCASSRAHAHHVRPTQKQILGDSAKFFVFCVLSLQVWDLRALKSAGASRTADTPGNGRGPIRLRGDGVEGGGGGGVGVTAIAVFDFHKAAITSLMWHWHDPSTFLAASRSFFLLFVF